MSLKMVPKIILEGTRLTFKTEIAFRLNEHPEIVGARRYRYHSPLISGEWCAFTNFPWGRGLINFNRDEEALAMETFQTWVRLFELQKYYSWIIDRFHHSTQVYQAMYENRHYQFDWLEERLKLLNFRLVFLYRSPESFEAARTERLKVSGKPDQYDNLQLFVQEQEFFEKFIEQSKLQILKVDISDNDLNAATDQIAVWMKSSGGLHLD